MSWRIVIIQNRCKLDLKMGYLVMRSVEGIKRIYLGDVSTIIIENTAISITGSLLYELASLKIKVIFCDNKRNPCSELVNYYGSHDCSKKLRQQVSWDQHTKLIVWTMIVADKIRKQSEHLKSLGKVDEENLLNQYLTQIELADTTNREGHAAKVYFNSVFGLDFTRTKENAINSGLNYGYSVILSCFNREIVANGYLTQLGIFHDNMFNPFNFGSDLMEPFRILVDRAVKQNILSVFKKEHKHLLVNVLNQKVKIYGKEQYVNNAIKIYCRSVFDALENNDVSLIKFYSYEL